MRMPRRVILWSVLPLLGLGFVWHAWKGEELIAGPRSGSNYALTTEETALLQDGDIILRRGSGMVSDMIAKLLAEDYDLSHCGVVVERGGAFHVVHSVSNSVSDQDGMQVHRLPDFVRQSKPGSVVVCRLRTEEDRSAIARKAVHYLRQQVPFDHHFDLKDTTSFYCSELLWRIILDEYDLDIFQGVNGQEYAHYRFTNFLDPALFEVILDHQKK